MSKKTFYVTTPIYYPSGRLHIGHTYTTVAADAIARYKRFTGHDVRFLTGTDEHGEKIQKTADEKGMAPIDYLDDIVGDIKKLWQTMEISYDDFIRTTEKRHEKAVQNIFQKLYDQGDIYLGEYEGWYCVPCESLWTDTQVGDDHKCPDCKRDVQKKKESSYFFKLSKYQQRLVDYYNANPDFCFPESRKNEMLNNFINAGLEDLSVSRTTFDWGIKVPFDEKHVIYVWIDALCNYITALGYEGEDSSLMDRYWPSNVQIVGKEIVRFHTIIWPALLMALDLPLPEKVYGHGWILFSEDKMSKSKGNIVYPEPIIERYGIDSLKYFLLREFTFGQDGNYTNRNFLTRINSDLANDLGNLLSRTISMIEKYNDCIIPSPKTSGGFHDELKSIAESMSAKVDSAMDRLQFNEALEEVWKLIRRSNKYVDETMPWALAKDESKKDELDTVLYNLAESLRIATVMISPILHITADKIFNQLGVSEDIRTYESSKAFGLIKEGTKINKGEILFPRLDIDKELGVMEEMFGKKKEEVNELPKEEIKEEKKGKEEITIDDFAKVELKVGKVLEAEKHPKADKLLVFKIKLKDEVRQIVSGIAKFYDPAELIGRNVVVVTNLKPVKLRGIESQGMILSAATEDDSKLVLISAQDIEDGVEVR
ncbi:methionyl-tRNA synthetase [Acetoanaerobium pronyense]|uniref:Methionine--tRNA ligase n=1 Tax=Acetoanaerobium pronyense TaxID=1482736 RepID=A0ABS4KLP3_9FIRM|nr:methionine--tRNA ligase [Acetoanaerobium pronyense]MBP2028066.1 methionyl-tRNA synthetase [Acetoanaerobium pronyense]